MSIVHRAQLLSIEESVQRSRQLRCCRSADLALATKAAETALMEWRQAWKIGDRHRDSGSTADSPHVRCGTLFEEEVSQCIASSDVWLPVGAVAAGIWWSLLPGGSTPERKPQPDLIARSHAALAQALFEDDRHVGKAEEGVAMDCIRAARADWQHRILRCMNIAAPVMGGMAEDAETGPPSTLFDAWSGAAAMILPWCGQTFVLLIDSALIAHMGTSTDVKGGQPASSGRPLPLFDAMADSQAYLVAEFRPLTVELGVLADLRVGDVLSTTHLLADPLILKVKGEGDPGKTFGAGYLGRTGTTRAIELTSG